MLNSNQTIILVSVDVIWLFLFPLYSIIYTHSEYFTEWFRATLYFRSLYLETTSSDNDTWHLWYPYILILLILKRHLTSSYRSSLLSHQSTEIMRLQPPSWIFNFRKLHPVFVPMFSDWFMFLVLLQGGRTDNLWMSEKFRVWSATIPWYFQVTYSSQTQQISMRACY